MMRLIFLLGIFLLAETKVWSLVPNGKNVRVLSFEQFEPYLHLKNDTVYLVNFWATWCAPCVAELPAIQSVEQKYSGKKFKVLLVSLDMPGQLKTRLVPFLLSKQIISDVVLLDAPDPNRWIDRIDKEWSGEIPFTVIYGKNFRDSYTQSFSYHTLDSIINQKIKLP
jgi:thiol-disulfide isomerase/thioredoxin